MVALGTSLNNTDEDKEAKNTTMNEKDGYISVQENKIKKLNVWDTILTFIANILGGGIIVIPYAMTTAGLINGIIINLLVITITMICCYLYICAMDMFKLGSISELCYISFGARSIYFINGLMAFITIGFIIMVEILFSELALSLVLHT